MKKIKLDKKNIFYEFYQNYLSNPETDVFRIQKDKKEYNAHFFEKITYSDLFNSILIYDISLKKQGLIGKRVIILHPPNKEIISLIFSMFHIGVIPVFIDPNVGIKHLKTCIKNSNAEVILTTVVLAPVIYFLTIGTSINKFIYPKGIKKLNTKPDTDSIHIKPLNKNIAGIFYTSGSTGTPKGVIWTHQNIKGQLSLLKQLIGSGKESVNLALFPLFLIYGPLLGNITIWPKYNLSKPINISSSGIIKFLKLNKVDYTFGSPIIWKNLLSYCQSNQESIPNIRSILCGGAPLSHEVMMKIQQKMVSGNFYMTYGATEALPISYSSIVKKELDGTILGKPFIGVDVRIKPITKNIKNVPSCNFELGEITIKGQQVTSGYIHDANKLINAQFETTSIHSTGDYGYLDNNNNLWYYGRKKHVIEDGGFRYFPIPIEKQIRVVLGEILCTIYVANQKMYLILEKKTFLSMMISKKELIARINEHILKMDYTFSDLLCFPKKFPLDKRHYSKLDRTTIQKWAFNQIK